MLHGIGSGYAEAKAFGSGEARFLKYLGSGYVLEAYYTYNIGLLYIKIILY